MRPLGKLIFESGMAVGTLAMLFAIFESQSLWVGVGFLYATLATYVGGEMYHRQPRRV